MRWILDRVLAQSTTSGGTLLKEVRLVWTGDFVTAVQQLKNVTNNKLGLPVRTYVQTSLTPNANGLIATITEPPTEDQLTRTTTVLYDDDFHAYPHVVTDAVGHATQLTYTPAGALATITDPNNQPTTFTYDVFGRPSEERRPDTGVTTYDYHDNLLGDPAHQQVDVIAQVDASRAIVSSSYFDGSGFLYRVERTADGAGQTVCIFRDKDDAARPYRISMPTFNCAHGGQQWITASFDSAGRLRTITDPDNKWLSYTYGADHGTFGRSVSVTEVVTNGVSLLHTILTMSHSPSGPRDPAKPCMCQLVHLQS
jgi:YD repeat-containing protein